MAAGLLKSYRCAIYARHSGRWSRGRVCGQEGTGLDYQDGKGLAILRREFGNLSEAAEVARRIVLVRSRRRLLDRLRPGVDPSEARFVIGAALAIDGGTTAGH